MATDFEISTGTTVVPTTGDRIPLVRQVLGIWTPYAVLYETTLSTSGGTNGTSLLSARADHTHAGYVAKVSGGTSGHIAVLTSDGSIADGGLPGAQYVLPVAGVSQLGGVKQGAGVSIANDGTLSANGAVAAAVITIDGSTIAASMGSPYTIPTTGGLIRFNKTTGAASYVVLNAASPIGTIVYLKDVKMDSQTNPITVTTTSGKIDGASSFTVASNGSGRTMIKATSTDWDVI